MNWPLVESYAKNIWAVCGPLVGVLIGAYVTSRIQRQHWLADQKRAEYRELLSDLSVCLGDATDLFGLQKLEKIRGATKIKVKMVRMIHNRIFTAGEIERLRVYSRWIDAVDKMIEQENGKQFGEAVGTILNELRAAALKDISS
jgi:hypothetical protein